MIYYFKCYQRADIWNFYKLLSEREPPGCEVVNFLNEQPIIEFREYDLADPGSKIDYDAFWEVGIRIPASEYDSAYQQATAGQFNIYINGKRQ